MRAVHAPLVVVVALIALLLPALALSPSASAASPAVSVVPSPDVTTGSPAAPTGNQLTAVAAASASSVWAVGSYNAGTAAAPLDQSLIEHFDGTSWTVVPSPDQLNANGAQTQNELLAVSADSPTDAWAVGYYVDLNLYGYPVDQLLVEHYDGTAWSLLPSTAQPRDILSARAGQNQFLGVDAQSPTDVWAVGQYHNGSSPQTLIEHFNGTGWSQVATPDPGTTADVLQSITTAGTGNLYAAGYAASNGVDQTLIEQYNGTTWTAVTSPDTSPTAANQLTSLSATSATDVWAAGWFTGGTATAPVNQTLLEHFDGTAWSIVTSPDTSATVGNLLTSVSADSTTDVWAVGSSVGGPAAAPVLQTLVEHYDGTAWSIVTSPDVTTTAANELSGAVAVSPTDLWAVGSASPGTPPLSQTLVEGTPPVSTTTVTSSVVAPVVGQSVTYTATVTGSATATAVGTVAFADNGSAISGCGAVPLTGGVATCTTLAGAAIIHTISASYGGDAVHLASSGTVALGVVQAATTTTVSTPVPSVIVGAPTAVTATVAATAPGSGVPTGTVDFTEGGTSLTGCAAVTLVAGAATCSYTPTTTGAHTLEAVYGGDADYTTSTATPYVLTVTTASTTTTVTSPANPSPAGQTVVFGATVAPVAPATGAPTGAVTFDDDGTPITGCTSVPVTAGYAFCLANMPLAGTFAITGVYDGSTAFAGSTSTALSQVVQAGALTIQDVQSASNPSSSGVVLSPVVLGSSSSNPAAVPVTFSNDQFAQSVGVLNTVSVFDGRGTEPGWTVSAQLETDFANGHPIGPPVANVIPADFLTLYPGAVSSAEGVSLTGVAAGPPATLSTTVPTTLCQAAPGSGGGSYACGASLSLSVPPYVAAGPYGATMVIITS